MTRLTPLEIANKFLTLLRSNPVTIVIARDEAREEIRDICQAFIAQADELRAAHEVKWPTDEAVDDAFINMWNSDAIDGLDSKHEKLYTKCFHAGVEWAREFLKKYKGEV